MNALEIKLTETFLDGIKWGCLLSCPMWIAVGCLIGKYWMW